MLDFADQKKLLDPLLKGSNQCADCDTLNPTWASLDFGVFVCSNCSGAHRALGPTITRVRSVSLDKWDKEWVANMLLSNHELNKYWESDPRSQDKKPKLGATLDEIKRYVFEKYIKRKFVKDTGAVDPLTSYKNGTFTISKQESPAQPQPKPTRPTVATVPHAPRQEPLPAKPKADICLLDFDVDHQPAPQQAPVQTVLPTQQILNVQGVQNVGEEDEFTDYTQPGSVTKDEGLISFEALLNQHKQPPQQPHYQSYSGLKVQNMTLHHPYNPNIAQHNIVYNSHFQPQQQYNPQLHTYSAQPTPNYQMAHNYSPVGHPYMGYPHTQQGHYSTYSTQVGVASYWK